MKMEKRKLRAPMGSGADGIEHLPTNQSGGG